MVSKLYFDSNQAIIMVAYGYTGRAAHRVLFFLYIELLSVRPHQCAALPFQPPSIHPNLVHFTTKITLHWKKAKAKNPTEYNAWSSLLLQIYSRAGSFM